MNAGGPRAGIGFDFVGTIPEQGGQPLAPPDGVGGEIPVPEGVARRGGEQAKPFLADGEGAQGAPQLQLTHGLTREHAAAPRPGRASACEAGCR